MKMLLHTGPKTQLGGLKLGLFRVRYQVDTDCRVKKLPKTPIINGMARLIANGKNWNLLFSVVMGCLECFLGVNNHALGGRNDDSGITLSAASCITASYPLYICYISCSAKLVYGIEEVYRRNTFTAAQCHV